MTQSFWILGPLPSLNDIIKSAKSGRGKGNAYSRMKAEWTDHVCVDARSKRLRPEPGRVNVILTWREKRRNRDPDNVHAAVKFILDGLVKAQVLKCDTARTIARIDHRPIEYVDEWHREPGVTVTLEAAL